VLAFGDSVTFGTGAASGEDYPSQLTSISGWVVVNRGIPGDTAEGAKARIAAALDETQPRLVIVEIGGNDFLRRVPESRIKENIRSILQIVKQSNVPVMLVATPRFSLLGAAIGSLPDAELYAELAEEEGVPLVTDVFAGVLSDLQLKSDQIHPNAAGYRKLAEGIAASLVKTGLLAKR
jgi:acyl-CoA hydrolase